MPLQIEKNVPIYNKPTKDLINLILSMQDGDSLFIPLTDYDKSKTRSCIANARFHLKGLNLKLITRTEPLGTRVWVVKD